MRVSKESVEIESKFALKVALPAFELLVHAKIIELIMHPKKMFFKDFILRYFTKIFLKIRELTLTDFEKKVIVQEA